MMRHVVLDTNVLVSALLTPHGKTAAIVALVNARQVTACYGAGIIEEYEEVLSRSRFNFSETDRAGLLMGIRHFGVLVNPPASKIALPDESDRVFYDTARAVGAFLVTGNIRHYPDEDFIVTPAAFLSLLQK